MLRHLLNPLDFSVEEIDALLDLSDDIQKRPEAYAHVCARRKHHGVPVRELQLRSQG